MVIFQVSVSNNGLLRTFYPLTFALPISLGFRQGTGQRIKDAQTSERPEIVEIVGHPPE
jgi:hypothetical protein